MGEGTPENETVRAPSDKPPFWPPPQGWTPGVDVHGQPAPEAGKNSRRLWLHLGASLLVCLFVIVAGGSNTGSDTAFYVTAIVAVGYWAAVAVLEVRWWRKGYERFWRPMYSWVLTLLAGAILGVPLAALLVAAYPGVSNSVVGVVDVFSPLLLLLIPRFRRWLFRQWKPYDSPAVAAQPSESR